MATKDLIALSCATVAAVLAEGRTATASTFENLDFEQIVAAFEGKGAPDARVLAGVKKAYCRDIPKKKKILRDLLDLLDENFSKLKVGSTAAYEITDEKPGSAPPTVTTERWRVLRKAASSVTVSIVDATGLQRTVSYSREAFVPKAFIDERRPMSCLILENFFGDPSEGTERRDGKSFHAVRYTRSGLGGVTGSETVARDVPFSVMSREFVLSGNPQSKSRKTNLVDFSW